MELFFEIFITASLSFMFTFVFAKFVSMASTADDLDKCEISASKMKSKLESESEMKALVDSIEKIPFDERKISASKMKSKSGSEPELKPTVESIEKMAFDEQYFVKQEEDEIISGDSIKIGRFQRMPVQEIVTFEECAVEESKRSVELQREIMVSDLNSEYFEGEFLEQSGFRKGICEIEIELVEEIEATPEGESEVVVGDEEGENRDSEMGDWEAIERKDLEELLGNKDIAISGSGEK